MPTVRQCLLNYPICYITYIESSSVSAKPNSAQLSRPILEIHLDGNGVIVPESDPDTARYNRIIAQPLPSVQSEVKNEGDVRRVYAQLINIVEQAFLDEPKVWHRWEAGPPGPGVNTTETIDTWWGVYINGHQRCAAIGELKRPGVIDVAEWRTVDAKVPTIRLGKEMRMYAHQYNCPQAFYFDGNYLLVLRFKATSRNHILQPDCNASCFWLYKEFRAETSACSTAGWILDSPERQASSTGCKFLGSFQGFFGARLRSRDDSG